MESLLKSKDKRGMGTGTFFVALILILVVLGGVMYFGVRQAVVGSNDPSSVTDCPDSTTTLNFNAKSFYEKATSVSGFTPYGRVDGSGIKNLSAVSSFGIGSNITDVFYSASDYIDTEEDDFEVTCGMTQAPIVYLKPTDAPGTFVVKSDAGTTLTDGGGANNATKPGADSVLELDLRIGAKQDYTTGELVIVAEFDNTTQADDISLGGFDSISTPEVYSDETSNSLKKTFEVPETENGATEEYTLKIYPESGKNIGTGGNYLRITYYSKQAFEDIDGIVQVGIENSDGTAKYEDTGDYDIGITA